jgi:hypothetical protein
VTADSQGFVRAACVARTVERGKNPEDGTGGGLATSTLLAAVERSWWGEEGAPGVKAFEGARTHERRNPELDRAAVVRKNGRSRGDGARAVGERFGFEGEINPRRGAPGASPGSGRTRKTARPGRERARRERWEPRRRYSGGTTKL